MNKDAGEERTSEGRSAAEAGQWVVPALDSTEAPDTTPWARKAAGVALSTLLMAPVAFAVSRLVVSLQGEPIRSIFLAVVVPLALFCGLGFLNASSLYHRLSPQRLNKHQLSFGCLLSGALYAINFYLLAVLLIPVQIYSGASVEELRTVSASSLWRHAGAAWVITLLVAFVGTLAPYNPERRKQSIVWPRFLRRAVIAIVIALLLMLPILLYTPPSR